MGRQMSKTIKGAKARNFLDNKPEEIFADILGAYTIIRNPCKVDMPEIADNTKAELIERLTLAVGRIAGVNQELLETKKYTCYYCGKETNDLSGNPGDWSIPLTHRDEPGKVKYHHISCVSERLVENQPSSGD